MKEVQTIENFHQCWFMLYALSMFQEIGKLPCFIKHKIFGIFTTICVVYTLLSQIICDMLIWNCSIVPRMNLNKLFLPISNGKISPINATIYPTKCMSQIEKNIILHAIFLV